MKATSVLNIKAFKMLEVFFVCVCVCDCEAVRASCQL